MILYRNIGLSEFFSLMNDEEIYGHCKNKTEEGMVCFFSEPFIWRTSSYQFLLIADIPERMIKKQVKGIYHVPKNFSIDTDIWDYSMGEKEISLSEYLLLQYDKKYIIDIIPIGKNSRSWVYRVYTYMAKK